MRVHQGPEATSIGAMACTVGSNIYFDPQHYNPANVHGQRLIAHELVHVLQQRAGRVRNPLGGGMAVVQVPGLEAEAERMSLLATKPQVRQVAQLKAGCAPLRPQRGTAGGQPVQARAAHPMVIQARSYTDTGGNRTTLKNRILAYFTAAGNGNLIGDAYWEESADQTYLLYNCGSIAGATGGYGRDYVSDALYQQLKTWWENTQAGTVEGGTTRTFGTAGVGGHRRRAQDYHNFTKVASANLNVAGYGNRRIILNFHCYVGASYANPNYQALPPPVPVVVAVPPPVDDTNYPRLGA